jgi:hypothetical protein
MTTPAGLTLGTADACGICEGGWTKSSYRLKSANLSGEEAEEWTLTVVQIPNNLQHPDIMRTIRSRQTNLRIITFSASSTVSRIARQYRQECLWFLQFPYTAYT